MKKIFLMTVALIAAPLFSGLDCNKKDHLIFFNSLVFKERLQGAPAISLMVPKMQELIRCIEKSRERIERRSSKLADRTVVLEKLAKDLQLTEEKAEQLHRIMNKIS